MRTTKCQRLTSLSVVAEVKEMEHAYAKQWNESRHINLIHYIGLDVHNDSIAIPLPMVIGGGSGLRTSLTW
jgi:hypothetical protein